MAVVESFIPVPTTPYKLDGVGVTTTEGLAVREMVTIGDALLRMIEQDEDDIEAILLAIA